MSDDISSWAIVEIFGHIKLAGRVTKDTSIFPMLRIDVPKTKAHDAFTKEYGPTSVFSILYVSEEIARLAADEIDYDPVGVYSPELITRSDHERVIDQYKKRIEDLRALPDPSRKSIVRNTDNYGPDDDEVELSDDELDDIRTDSIYPIGA